jgi:hypothetical protein
MHDQADKQNKLDGDPSAGMPQSPLSSTYIRYMRPHFFAVQPSGFSDYVRSSVLIGTGVGCPS